VIATQNPIEQEGTYPLPEAQSDRFLLKINIGYPTETEEEEIVNRYTSEKKQFHLRTVLNKKQLLALQEIVRQVPIANEIKRKAIKIVTSTRDNKSLLQFGASPRASIGLILASKARALLMGRNHVSMEDITKMAYPILRHRIILNFEAERKGIKADDAIKEIIDKAR
jgi:MoxR-like ATPase